jgi:hypothetical protein
MHRGLPWAGAVSVVSVTGGFENSPGMKISSLYSSTISLLRIVDGHEFHQVVLYMHAIMMQHLVLRQQQLLKYNTHAKLQS